MAERVYVFSASSAQRSLWFLDQLAPGGSVYNLHNSTRLSSALNVAALERSVNEIVRRHEALRTTFKAVDGELFQVVTESLGFALPVTDLRHLPEPELEEEAVRISTQEAHRPFDLAKGPLLRASMLRMGEEDYILLLTMHHIVCDFWSMNVFQEELSTLYEAFCAGQPSPLPELPIQYGDYAEWERQWLEGPVARTHLAYWKKQLADLQSLKLPTDWPRPAVPSFLGAGRDFWLPEPLYTALLKLSHQEKVTLFITMLAAFQTLLYRYTGQDDIAVGTPVANRNRAEVEQLVGFFVNSLVMRTDLSGNPSFRQLLARVRETALDAYAHQELPFENVVRELKPERGVDHNPLFQVHFQLFSDMEADDTPDPLIGEPLDIEAGTAKFDLAMDLSEYPDGIWAHLEYSTDLFGEGTIAKMEGHFRTLLEGIAADPDRQLSELPLMSESELQQVLVDWNDTETEYPRGMCLHQLFEAQAGRTPDNVALVFQQEQLTYEALNRQANQLAHYLQSLGVGPETLVAICAERSPQMIIGLLGILKAGGAYLPLDPSYPRERLRFILEDAQPGILLTQKRLIERIPNRPPKCFLFDANWNRVVCCSETNPVSGVVPRNLAYVIYTSGSTGKPKGVMVHSQAVCNHLLWMQAAFPLTEADRVLLKYSFNFDASICEIFGPLIVGARLIITEPAGHWDISRFIQLLMEQQITVLDVVPSMLQALLEERRFSACHSLRQVTSGGEPLSVELRDRFFSQMDAQLNNVYGPTEATIGATSWTCQPGDSRQCVPIGRPIANTQIYLLDSHLNPVPVGVPGELCIGGDGVARGYLNRPELTSEKFIPSPFSNQPEARLYKTGDLARYLPEAGGSIEYLGRIDGQVKVRGYRIELGEIENTLAQHSSVRACAVMPIEDQSGHTRLAAYIVPVPDRPELWPSLGEYDVYDELLYYAMTHDEARNRSYRAAINRAVKGRTVLDIGTGADAILARFSVEAGAKQVYAIEAGNAAYERARSLVEDMGLADKITLIHGDSTEVQLPEKVDVCVSEILGTIGSSEGVTSILNDARRFLKDGGMMIPQRCITQWAAVSLPEELADHPKLTELPSIYLEEVFKRVGYPFDLRICIKNFPHANILSDVQVFEDLDFTDFVQPEFESDVVFTINRRSRVDGFLLWLNLYPAENEMIDSLSSKTSWLPLFVPAFCPGLEVSEGDLIQTRYCCSLGEGGRMPDYTIGGTVIRKQSEPIAFSYRSFYRTTAFGQNPFYKALFANMDRQSPPLRPSNEPISHTTNGDNQPNVKPPEGHSRGLVPELRQFLQEQLPEYMIPSSFTVVDDLPVTASGKLDRRALRVRSQESPDPIGAYIAPRNETEEVLAKIWSELLGIERIGVYDNFFELGGDSILSIQIVTRANQAGLRLRPAQLFQQQTIAEIAAVAGAAPVIQAEQGILTGAVLLTPVQHWFFEQNLADPHHYNLSVLTEAPRSVNAAKLNMVLDLLIAHHDALRLRFCHTASGWQQAFAPANQVVPLALLDLSNLSAAERSGVIEKAAAELQASLDLESGPMVRAALIDVGKLKANYLLLVVHHLVVDGVSWRILLEDLWTAYEQLMAGEELQLPAKTTSFQGWARRLTEYAQSVELRQEVAYWSALCTARPCRLPTDYSGRANTMASARTIAVALSVDETDTLLRKVPKIYHTEINDVLLTALVQAFAHWTGQRSLLIDLEGHGREIIFDDVDLSRTVGWFTTIFPVLLDLGQASAAGEALKSIKEQLRRIPNRGIGYGVLRYLSPDRQVAAELQALPQPEVAFNYLGQFGQSYPEPSEQETPQELTGSNLSPRTQRRYLLEIDGGIYDGRLQLDWVYSESIHRRSTIEGLVECFAEALRSLISHCVSPGAGGYTPSDFSAARVTQDDLSKLLSRIGSSQSEATDSDEL